MNQGLKLLIDLEKLSVCKICRFDFNKFYGQDLADDYIEVHHIKELSKGEQEVDPFKDLIPVRANCHRILHKRKINNAGFIELKTWQMNIKGWPIRRAIMPNTPFLQHEKHLNLDSSAMYQGFESEAAPYAYQKHYS